MKKLFIPIMAVFFVSFTSCDDIKDLADIEVQDIELSTDIDISPSDSKNNSSITFNSGDYTIDPKSNADIDKYFDKIKTWTITDATATVKSVESKVKEATLFAGSVIKVGSATYTLPNDFTIKAGAEFKLDDATFLQNAINIISKGDPVVVSASGELSDYIVFTLTITTVQDIVVNPL